MAKVRVNVSVAGDRPQDFAAVAKRLRKAGLAIDQQHRDVGVVSGRIEAKQLPALRQLPGVSSVEEERQVRVPPPDEEVQ